MLGENSLHASNLYYFYHRFGDAGAFLSASWNNIIFCLDIWVLTLPRCRGTGVMSVFWTSDSLSSTYFLLSFPYSPLFCLSPKCFSETLFRKEKIVSWLIRTMVKFIAISLAVEWGIMGKMRCISVTVKFLSNRWKDFTILFEFSLYETVSIVTIWFHWSFLFKNEHGILEQPENLPDLNTECQGQVLLESKISGIEKSTSPHWHIGM